MTVHILLVLEKNWNTAWQYINSLCSLTACDSVKKLPYIMILYFGILVKLEAGQGWDYFCPITRHAMYPKHFGLRFCVIINRFQTNESVALEQ
jgi:hypothetical protein